MNLNQDELDAGLAATPGYRYADVVGNRLFVAGQVPIDPAGRLVGAGDPRIQARTCLDNMNTLMAVHGFDVGDLRHLTVHVVGEHKNLTSAWDAVTDWFADEVPPATLLGAALLGYRGQLVEIDASIMRAP